MPVDPDTPLDQTPFDDPNEELFFAIAWMDRPGVAGDFAAKLRRAHERGADLDGESEDGETPLTTAILDGMGSPTAVRVLLDLGADPSKRAASGFTPWSACIDRIGDRVVSEEMEAIRALLVEHGADQSDERLLRFAEAIRASDEAEVRRMLDEGLDLASPMLAPLESAIANDDVAMLRLLLEHGANVEGNQSDPHLETPLIRAAVEGRLEMVRLLVESGARVERSVYEDPRCTAEFLTREAGHEEVADWLRARGSQATPAPDGIGDEPAKFGALFERRTNGINYGVTTERIVQVLRAWDERFGVEVSDVAGDRAVVSFTNLPDDVSALAREIHALCPDVVDQGYGCMDEMLSMAEESGQELPPDLAALVDGIDFGDEDFGLLILQRDLKAKRQVALWWD